MGRNDIGDYEGGSQYIIISRLPPDSADPMKADNEGFTLCGADGKWLRRGTGRLRPNGSDMGLYGCIAGSPWPQRMVRGRPKGMEK